MRAHGLDASPVYEVRVARPSGTVVTRLQCYSRIAARECRDFLLRRHPGFAVTIARRSSARLVTA